MDDVYRLLEIKLHWSYVDVLRLNLTVHADGLESVTALTSSTGTLAQSYTYDSFGNLLASPGSVSQPFTYTGREVDPETGLYYYRARYYDQTTGRFLQEDPIGIVPLGSRRPNHSYVYVGNNPIKYVDPYGLQAQNCGEDKCREKAEREYQKCIADIKRLENVYTAGCVGAAILAGGLTAWGTGDLQLGLFVGGVGTAACFAIDWESLGFMTGRAYCGFLRQKIYDICRASQ